MERESSDEYTKEELMALAVAYVQLASNYQTRAFNLLIQALTKEE